MAGRPNKEGLDYFPMDCHTDEKIDLIEAEFGLKGFAVIVKLFQKIYRGHGYYCEWNEDIALLFARKNLGNCDANNLINEIVSASIRRNIFSEKLYHNFGILTSQGVQKRYIEAVSRRDKVEMKKEYLLLSADKIPKNVYINSINVDGNSNNTGSNSQSKVKESKVKKSKEYIDRFAPPTVEEVKKYCDERKNNIDPCNFVDFYTSKGWMVGKNKMKDWKAAVRTWEKNRTGTQEKPQYMTKEQRTMQAIYEFATSDEEREGLL